MTDGTNNAIVWVVGAQGDNRLHGYNGDNGAVIYAGGGANEVMTGTRKWNSGIAARGSIYVANDNRVYAFRMPRGTPTPTPTATATLLATDTPTPHSNSYGYAEWTATATATAERPDPDGHGNFDGHDNCNSHANSHSHGFRQSRRRHPDQLLLRDPTRHQASASPPPRPGRRRTDLG